MEEEAIGLLTKIAHNTESAANVPIITILIGGVFGLLTAVVSGWLVYLQNKNKSHAQIVTTERLRWLQDIRKGTAKAFTLMDMQLDLLRRPATSQEKMDELSVEVMQSVHEIQLFLNPHKQHQSEIFKAFSAMLQLIQECMSKPKDIALFDGNKKLYTQEKQKAYNALSELGKETWNQIKKELK